MSSCNTDVVELSVENFFVLNKINLEKINTIAVAVSGGADSICLLTAINNIFGKAKAIKAITVNHNIRPVEQTCGDADYVEQYCKKIGVQCFRFDIPRGYIKELAKQRALGIEEAARYERYRLFDRFIDEENIDYLCLAHNQNDQIETVIMRFLSGSSIGGLSGIPSVRGKFIRPLVNVKRNQIEAYLLEREIEYKTDLTNFDTAMFRNTVRNIIMPVLKDSCQGYEKSILNLAKKAYDDEQFINEQCDIVYPIIEYKEVFFDDNLAININAIEFYKLDNAVKRRLLYRFIEKVGPKDRIPYSLIERILDNKCLNRNWVEEACGIVIECKDMCFFIHKKIKKATEDGFFVIIKENGSYRVGDFVLEAFLNKENSLCKLKLCNRSIQTDVNISGIDYPFAVRSIQSGDEVLTAFGSKKTLSRIITDWHGGNDKQSFIVVQSLMTPQQEIKALLGSFLGYQDWIVK